MCKIKLCPQGAGYFETLVQVIKVKGEGLVERRGLDKHTLGLSPPIPLPCLHGVGRAKLR